MSSAVSPAVPALLTVREVATMLGCSPRHIYRLADAGRMPGPLRLGVLVRWDRSTIESWVGDGCPRVRSVTRGGSR